MDVPKFLNYIRAFNAQDYATQYDFYTDDVKLIIPDPRIGTLEGKSGILEHYKPIHASAEETVVPIIVMCDRGKVFFQMETYFRYLKEVERAVHDYHVYPGDVIKIVSCAVYDLDQDGKMTTITCHMFSEEKLGQVDVKEKIRESEQKADADLRIYKD